MKGKFEEKKCEKETRGKQQEKEKVPGRKKNNRMTQVF